MSLLSKHHMLCSSGIPCTMHLAVYLHAHASLNILIISLVPPGRPYRPLLDPAPTNLLMPTLFALPLPFPALCCASIGCSFSHRSSSRKLSMAMSVFQSACCKYKSATSYLREGEMLWSAFSTCPPHRRYGGLYPWNLLGDLASHHPPPDFAFLDLLFFAFEWPWREGDSTFVVLARYEDRSPSLYEVVGVDVV